MNEGEHPRRRWAVLSGLFFVYMASNGVTLHTLPLLYPELMETFGWKASEVTLPATIFFLVGAFTSPPAGWLLDRYSSRAIIAIGESATEPRLDGLLRHPITMATGRRLRPVGTGTVTLCGLVSNMVMLTSWFAAGRGRATGNSPHGLKPGRRRLPPAGRQWAGAPRMAAYCALRGSWRRAAHAGQRVAAAAGRTALSAAGRLSSQYYGPPIGHPAVGVGLNAVFTPSFLPPEASGSSSSR